MDQEVLQRRNVVFQLVYNRLTGVYAQFVPTPVRIVFEILLLLIAAAVFSMWMYIHHVYITNPTDCLESITERPFPYDTILQVEVFTNSTQLWEKREKAARQLYDTIALERAKHTSYRDEEETSEQHSSVYNLFRKGWPYASDFNMSRKLLNGLDTVLTSMGINLFGTRIQETEDDDDPSGSESIPVLSDPVLPAGGESSSPEEPAQSSNSDTEEEEEEAEEEEEVAAEGTDNSSLLSAKYPWLKPSTDDFYTSSYSFSAFLESVTLYEVLDLYEIATVSYDYTLLEFSQEPGFLSLSQSSRTRLNISITRVYVDPDNAACFGGSFGHFLTKYSLGYDMMIITSFKNLLPMGQPSGYVKNIMSGDQYYYRVQWMGKWRYGVGVLPALFFTLVSSVLLRHIHYHIFKFLTHFNQLLNQGVPMPVQTAIQLPFLIITYAAIGLIIVMSEALGDDSVFSLLMVATVWEADQFYAIFCTKEASKKFFPMFFYLFHFLPYAYYIRFNGQFWFIPFLFHWIMIQLTVLFFLHRFELPSQPLQARQFREAGQRQRVHIQGPHLIVAQPPPIVIPEERAIQEEGVGGRGEEGREQEGGERQEGAAGGDVQPQVNDAAAAAAAAIRPENSTEEIGQPERRVLSEFVSGNTAEQAIPQINVYVTDHEHRQQPDMPTASWLPHVDADRTGADLLSIGQRVAMGVRRRVIPRSDLVRRRIPRVRQNEADENLE